MGDHFKPMSCYNYNIHGVKMMRNADLDPLYLVSEYEKAGE